MEHEDPDQPAPDRAGERARDAPVQKAAERRLVCERDRLPELGVVILSSFVPFLSLNEAEAGRWAAQRE